MGGEAEQGRGGGRRSVRECDQLSVGGLAASPPNMTVQEYGKTRELRGRKVRSGARVGLDV